MIWTAFLAVFSFSFASAQQQKNVSLIGHLDYQETLSDIWAYVDSAGKEYALVGVYDGVSIVDLDDPTQPAELHFLPGVETIWRDLKTYGPYAYVSNEGGDGLRIIDLSGLPASVVYKDTVMSGISTIHNLYIDQGKLYVAGLAPNVFGGGMVIYDLTNDAWNPVQIGSYTDRYVHDVYVRNNIAYLGEILHGRLTILDVSNPALLVPLGTRTYSNSFTHNTWLNDQGNVCFTTDELPAAYLYSWEVSDPGDIIELDRISSSLSRGLAIPHNTHVLNDYLVTSYYRDGLNIVDASRPGNLVEVGYFDSSDTLVESGYNGAWGAYPFLPSGLFLVTDIEKGLFVLQPNLQRACYLEGNVIDAVSGFPLSRAQIRIRDTRVVDQSTTVGNYAVGIAEAGTYVVEYAKLGYQTETRALTLSNGQLVVENVSLTPLPEIAYQLFTYHADSLQAVSGTQVRLIAPGEEQVLDLVTDGNGQVSIPQLLPTTYEVQVGKWGFQMQSQFLTLTANSLRDTLWMKEGYEDDFNFDLGWTVSGTAQGGNWERGEPIGTTDQDRQYVNPQLDLDGDIGTYAFVTGNLGGNAGTDDVDDGQTILTSPLMDLSRYNEPLLQFQWWFVNYNTAQGGIGNDYLRVEISDGVQAVSVAVTATQSGFANYWALVDSFRVADFFSLQDPLFVRVITEDGGAPNLVEAGFDGFAVKEGNPTWATALEGEASPFRCTIYPNPIQDRVNLDWEFPSLPPGESFQLEIHNSQGQVLLRTALNGPAGAYSWDFPHPSGFYVLRVLQHGQPLITQKFVK